MRRRAIADAAVNAGLGRVVRIHREQRLRSEVIFLPLAVLPIIVGVLLLNEVSGWLAVALTYVFVLWLIAALIRWFPMSGRRWFAVAEHGLLVWTRTAPPTAILWKDVVGAGISKPGTYMLRWSDGELTFRATSRRDSLIDALEKRKAVAPPFWWLRPASMAAAVLVTIVASTVQFGPAVVDAALGKKPESLADVNLVCLQGKGFGRATAYTGPGPHPLLFSDEAKTVYGGGMVKASVPPYDVQLVACKNGVVRAPGNVFLGVCDYGVPNSQDRYTYHVYQGRQSISVRETRTGRVVASLTADGPKRLSCERLLFVNKYVPHSEEWQTVPDNSAYLQQLSSLVNDKARR